jgi:hypothetical protein
MDSRAETPQDTAHCRRDGDGRKGAPGTALRLDKDQGPFNVTVNRSRRFRVGGEKYREKCCRAMIVKTVFTGMFPETVRYILAGRSLLLSD